jgi:hypothetical protein
MEKANKWARLLAYVTGLANQELLLQNKYLAAEEQLRLEYLRIALACRSGSSPNPPLMK